MKPKFPILPQIGDLLELEIAKMIFRGLGLARWKGIAVLVPQTAAGDRILGRVSAVKGRYLQARIEEIVVPSIQRVQPECRHFPACGGCQWQHLSLTFQREWKEKILHELLFPLARWGEIAISPILPVSPPQAYRTRAQIKVGQESGQVHLGFFRQGSRELEEVTVCPALHPGLQEIYGSIRELTHPTIGQLFPGLKGIWMQRGSPGGEIILTLLVPSGKRAALRLLHRGLKECSLPLCGVALAWGNENRVYDRIGAAAIEMSMMGLKLKVGPTCFFQVGERGAEALSRVIDGWARQGEKRRVLDLYCGVGALTLPLAPQVELIVGVEAQAEPALLARDNARSNRFSNVRILHSTAEKALSERLSSIPFDLVIVDPPRSGLTIKVREWLLKLAPLRMIYCSCNPSTLARDLADLIRGGYQCREVQPLDLFPDTYHFETLVLLERKLLRYS